jgi:DNA-binding YbaB/EbfC family protein
MANPLKGIGQLGGLLKQAQEMAENAKRIEEELAQMTFEASSGGGVVTAVVTGKGELRSIKIEPAVVDPEDIETLQDLVTSAVRAANEEAAKAREEKMREVTGGMDLSGIPGLGGILG